MFFDQYAKYNSGYHIILNVIDVNSKVLHRVALKSKIEVYKAMKKFIEEDKVPIKHLVTDAGSELINKNVMELLKKHNISLHNTTSKHMSVLLRESTGHSGT